jgi:hypothetical protein
MTVLGARELAQIGIDCWIDLTIIAIYVAMQ